MDATVADIVEENNERRSELFADYDPHYGIGSPIERKEAPVTPDTTVRLPVDTMHLHIQALRKLGSLREWAKHEGRDVGNFTDEFIRQRCQMDFEFWAHTAANIELDAETREERGADVAPLVLNRAQRIYFEELWRQWIGGVPVRIILLKARQWGGSTLTQMFFAWVQRYHRQNWNSFICNLSLDQARNIRRMYERMVERYPEHLETITLAPYEGSTNIKEIRETDSIVGITSIERPDSPRSYDIHLAHLSEVGLWPSTEKVNARDFAQAITGAVSKRAGTIIVEESTARGVGTYFHGHWQDAKSGESSYERVFIAWFDIPKYTEKVDDVQAFIEYRLRPSVEDDEVQSEEVEIARRLWSLGTTLEGIRWYFEELREFKGDLQAMRSEYPSTPEEAFQSTGRRFFPMDLSTRVRNQTTEPKETGMLIADETTGEGAFENIHVRELRVDDAPLRVWRRPEDKVWWNAELLNPEDKIIKRRFCSFVDFGGKTKNADWSVATIVDRIKMLAGGPAEVVARLRCHMRPDLFAWASARLAFWYDQALLAYEINRHRRDRGDEVRGFEPEWSLAVIEEIMDEYDNLYLREVQDRIDEPVRYEVGFHTNQSTKPMILNTLEAGLSTEPGGQTFFDPDLQMVDEMDTFERKEDGRLGAVEGNFDDIIISDAGAAWLALKYMDPPVRVEPVQRDRPKPTAARF